MSITRIYSRVIMALSFLLLTNVLGHAVASSLNPYEADEAKILAEHNRSIKTRDDIDARVKFLESRFNDIADSIRNDTARISDVSDSYRKIQRDSADLFRKIEFEEKKNKITWTLQYKKRLTLLDDLILKNVSIIDQRSTKLTESTHSRKGISSLEKFRDTAYNLKCNDNTFIPVQGDNLSSGVYYCSADVSGVSKCDYDIQVVATHACR